MDIRYFKRASSKPLNDCAQYDFRPPRISLILCFLLRFDRPIGSPASNRFLGRKISEDQLPILIETERKAEFPESDDSFTVGQQELVTMKSASTKCNDKFLCLTKDDSRALWY